MKAWRCLLASLFLFGPTLVGAEQAMVAGRVTESGALRPIQGVLVNLLNPAGEFLQRRLTNSSGRFRFPDLPAGRYSVSADMIGYAATESDRFAVEANTIHPLDLEISIAAIHLDGLDVTGERRCDLDPDEGIVLARLWSEIREALTRATFTGGVPFVYEVESVKRHLSRNASRVIDEESLDEVILSGVPYVSLDPEVFGERGYVFRSDSTNIVNYYAPDADVLLSDVFTETHCFQLKRGDGENQNLIGIGFEPLDGRDLPEIEGVLWVDPGSTKLSHVEFRFRNVLRGPRQKHLGGRMEFTELPSGLWIISSWYLRLPTVPVRASARWGIDGRQFRPDDLLVIREVGGNVRLVRDPEGEPILDADAGLVLGIVVDAETEEPIPNVTIRLGDTGRLARTNADGRFRFTEIPEGTYTFTFADADGGPFGEVEEHPRPGVQTFIRFAVHR